MVDHWGMRGLLKRMLGTGDQERVLKQWSSGLKAAVVHLHETGPLNIPSQTEK